MRCIRQFPNAPMLPSSIVPRLSFCFPDPPVWRYPGLLHPEEAGALSSAEGAVEGSFRLFLSSFVPEGMGPAPIPVREAWSRNTPRYSRGEIPTICLNFRLNVLKQLKPVHLAISPKRSRLLSISLAFATLISLNFLLIVVLISFRKSAARCIGET